jgi:hypothetical protein
MIAANQLPKKGENLMATQSHVSPQMRTAAPSAAAGANIVALDGIGLVGYGVMFLIRNFTGFIELGLTPEHVGATPEQIQAFSLDLYEYISHLQVAVSAFIIALGVAVIALAWFGIRTGQKWAMWTAFITPVIGVAIAVPLHFPYGIGTLGHLGLIYLDAVILLVGTVMSYNALKSSQ